MKQTSNKDMLNAIRNQASAEYQERIPAVASDLEARSVLQKFQDFPTAKNEFLKTLTEKVVKTEFFSRVYSNPLKMLKKGTLPYGSSIEELFVTHAKVKGFLAQANDVSERSMNWVGNYSAGELTKLKPADIRALYVTRNFQYVYEVSISDAQMKAAFMNGNGLSELVNQLVGSLTSGAELQEYEDMKRVLSAAARGEYLVQKNDGQMEYSGEGSVGSLITGTDKKYLTSTRGVNKAMKVIQIKKSAATAHVDDSYAAPLAIQLRAYAQKLRFMKDDCNMAGVKTFSNIDDLVFLTTPESQAGMDVELLAQAFNISKAEAQYRTIIVDELPSVFAKTLSSDGTNDPTYWKNKGVSTESSRTAAVRTENAVKCLGMIIDRNFLQVIDTVNESRQFENGRALMTNVFLHRQGIMANCYFANAVAFIADET